MWYLFRDSLLKDTTEALLIGRYMKKRDIFSEIHFWKIPLNPRSLVTIWKNVVSFQRFASERYYWTFVHRSLYENPWSLFRDLSLKDTNGDLPWGAHGRRAFPQTLVMSKWVPTSAEPSSLGTDIFHPDISYAKRYDTSCAKKMTLPVPKKFLRWVCKPCIISSLQAKGDLPIDQFHSRQEVKQGMAQVIVRENEGLENALKRFKRACARDGVMAEVRKREHYE